MPFPQYSCNFKSICPASRICDGKFFHFLIVLREHFFKTWDNNQTSVENLIPSGCGHWWVKAWNHWGFWSTDRIGPDRISKQKNTWNSLQQLEKLSVCFDPDTIKNKVGIFQFFKQICILKMCKKFATLTMYNHVIFL